MRVIAGGLCLSADYTDYARPVLSISVLLNSRMFNREVEEGEKGKEVFHSFLTSSTLR
jgi:hypothetical protein